MSWGGYKPYVSVGERKAKALKQMEKLRKKGMEIQPVTIEGRKIAKNFWGKSWCDHLESFSDYENRLPRGRTYARNGSICHLGIKKGEIESYVSGSSLYKVEISITTLAKKKWNTVRSNCSGEIDSLLSLLQGKIPDRVLEEVTNQQNGLFPTPREIKYHCNCPDYASMCKHVAAVLYGIGAQLDHSPELLFELRGVNHEELISKTDVSKTGAGTSRNRISLDALGDVFGIDIGGEEDVEIEKPKRAKKKPKAKKKATRKVAEVTETDSITGQEVAALRKKFKMAQTEFSILIGVSGATISKWENTPGELKLKSSSLSELNAAKKFTKARAWKKLESIL